MEPNAPIDPADFAACDLRTGTILRAEPLENARRPAYVLHIDFGPLGILKSTAQLTLDYTPEELPGKHIAAVVNFPPKQVGPHQSRCLVLGAVQGPNVSLLELPRSVPAGTPIS